MRGHQHPDRDQAELPQRHLPGPTGQDGEREGDDGVDAHLAEEEGAADVEDQREQGGRITAAHMPVVDTR